VGGVLCWAVILLTVFGSRFLYVFCGACGMREILGFLRMWRYRLGLFCRNVIHMLYLWVSTHSSGSMSFAIFYFLVHFFPLIKGTYVYFMCTRVAPICAF
jgi:hypothetical protein